MFENHLILVLLIYVFCLNFLNLLLVKNDCNTPTSNKSVANVCIDPSKPSLNRSNLPESFTSVAYVLGINQRWSFFAPAPRINDGWFIAEATLSDGKTIDLLNNGEIINFKKPKNLYHRFKNHHWQKFHANLTSRQNKEYLPYFARYLIRNWNINNPPERQVTKVRIIFMLERTELRNRTPRAWPMVLINYEMK